MKMVRISVEGRVQGVWFRSATREEALRLRLKGEVRSLNDGRVEITAIGENDAVDALIRWARRGPPLSQVSRIDVHPIPSLAANYHTFTAS
ncbi:MAG: acylphosphatase [Gammaproteobacteria bacterium]|nr:acylphosphatase [Gammaproteobacteria bacterium]